MKKEKLLKLIGRIGFDLLVLASVFLLPFWATIIFSILGLILFDKYFEFVLFILFIDLLFGGQSSGFFEFRYTLTVGSIILFILNLIIRNRLLFINK